MEQTTTHTITGNKTKKKGREIKPREGDWKSSGFFETTKTKRWAEQTGKECLYMVIYPLICWLKNIFMILKY